MATIAEKSRTKEIIDRLQGIMNNASPVPLASGKVMIYKDEVQSLLSELASKMEIELKTYHEVNDRKGKIINEAKKEAEKIIYQAEHSASRMRVTKRATNVAPLDFDNLNEEELGALGNANEIYAASLIYTDEMLTEVTNMISDAYHNIRGDYEIILQVLEEKLNVLTNNKEELMTGLQEMEVEDRSQQILEIGQLLSNELYNERIKSKMASDEYEDGSVQLSLNLQEEQEEKTRLAEEEAKMASEALAQVMAERDALMATVAQMKQEGMKETVRSMKASGGPVTTTSFLNKPQVTPIVNAGVAPVVNAEIAPKFVKMVDDEVRTEEKEAPKTKEAAVTEEDEEYEIVYVTEDELEEGEEYEIEYVDEDELEEDEEYEIEYVDEDEPEEVEDEVTEVDVEESEDKVVEEDIAEPEGDEEESEGDEIEKVATEKNDEVDNADELDADEPDENTDEVAEEVVEEEVKEAIKELEELEKETEEIPIIPHFKKSEKVASAPSEQIAKMAAAVTTKKEYSGLISRAVANREKQEAPVRVEEEMPIDDDVKVDEQGNEFVQATMKFDEDFEIMEF